MNIQELADDLEKKAKRKGLNIFMYILFFVLPLLLINGIFGTIEAPELIAPIIVLVIAISDLIVIVVWSIFDIRKNGLRQALFFKTKWTVIFGVVGLFRIVYGSILSIVYANLPAIPLTLPFGLEDIGSSNPFLESLLPIILMGMLYQIPGMIRLTQIIIEGIKQQYF